MILVEQCQFGADIDTIHCRLREYQQEEAPNKL
jgi:hypothetical protein